MEEEREPTHVDIYVYIYIFSLPLFVLSRSLSIDCELVSNPKASSVPSARSFLGDAADKETSSTLYQVGGNGRREVTRSGTPVRCSPPSPSSIHLVLPFPHSRPPPSRSSLPPALNSPSTPPPPPPSRPFTLPHQFILLRPTTAVYSFRLTFPCPAVGGRTYYSAADLAGNQTRGSHGVSSILRTKGFPSVYNASTTATYVRMCSSPSTRFAFGQPASRNA